jgi:endoplasmic reticulum-Golgi intermediate compartment protein 2
MERIKEFVKEFDIFTKLDLSHLDQTKQGGLASLIALTLISYLCLSEFYYHTFVPVTDYSIEVDTKVQEWIYLSFKIDIATPCGQLVVATVDAGEEKTLLNDQLTAEELLLMDEAGNQRRGCSVEAQGIKLNRVNGKLVFLPLTGLMFGPLGQILVAMDHSVNFSHQIIDLSFRFDPNYEVPVIIEDGKNPLGNYSSNPLKGLSRPDLKQSEHVKYKLAVIPTRYFDEKGEIVRESAQYAVKGYSASPGDPKSTYFLPGIYFEYDLEPLSVSVFTESKSIYLLLKRILGILSGVFICLGLIHHLSNFLIRRIYLPSRNRILYSQLKVDDVI